MKCKYFSSVLRILSSLSKSSFVELSNKKNFHDKVI